MSFILPNDNYAVINRPLDTFMASNIGESEVEPATRRRKGNEAIYLPWSEITSRLKTLLCRCTDFIIFRGKTTHHFERD